MSPFLYAGILLAATTNFGIGAYVFVRDPRNAINRSFFLFTAGIALWCAGFILLSITGSFIFDKFILYGGLISAFGFFIFTSTFPEKYSDLSLSRVLRWGIPFFIFATLLPFNLVIKDAIVHPGGKLEPINGPLLLPYIATISGYVFIGLWFLFRHYKRSRGIYRLQIQYLFFGALIFIGVTFVFAMLLPAFNISQFNVLGPLSSIIFVGCVGYAIVRHQLLDIRIVIQRSTVYSILLGIIVGTYLMLLALLGIVFEQRTPATAFIAGLLTAVIGAFGAGPLQRYFTKVTDKIFFKEKYDYADAVKELSSILNWAVEIKDIVDRSRVAIQKILKASYVRFALFRIDDADTDTIVNILRRYEEAPITLPIVLENDLLGICIIGPKRSGDAYTKEDLRLLETFSIQAAVALEKAALYEQVKEYSEELEERVLERTAQLKQAQEQQRQSMAEISHGLLTPLTLIKGELGSLRARSSAKKKIAALEAAIDKVTKFTYDLMQLAQLESEQEEGTVDEIDMSELLEELVEYFSIMANEKNIAVYASIDPNITLRADKEQMEEMITAIVSNSVKYMPAKKKKREITITARVRDRHLEMRIADTGTGIPAKDLPHIFERFYRVRENGFSDISGAGLGLAIAKKIAERHGGTIEAQNAIGEGVEFVITLPITN